MRNKAEKKIISLANYDLVEFTRYIKEEIEIIMERDAAIKSPVEVFLYPSFKAVLRHRIAHWIYNKKMYFFGQKIILCNILKIYDIYLIFL